MSFILLRLLHDDDEEELLTIFARFINSLMNRIPCAGVLDRPIFEIMS